MGDYDAALAAFQRSLRLLGTNKNSNLVAVLTNLGNAYATQGNYAKALQSFTQSLALSKELRDLNQQAIALNSLARLYVNQGDEGLAEDCYRQALELRKDSKVDASFADLLANYGVWLAKKGRHEEALGYYQRALESIPLADKSRTARLRQNIGNLYRRQNQYEQAQKSYEASLAARCPYPGLRRHYFGVRAQTISP